MIYIFFILIVLVTLYTIRLKKDLVAKESNKRKIDEEIKEKSNEVEKLLKQKNLLESEVKASIEMVKVQKARSAEIRENVEHEIATQKQLVDRTAQLYKVEKINKIDQEVKLYKDEKLKDALNEEITLRGRLEQQTNSKREELFEMNELMNDLSQNISEAADKLNDYQLRQAAVNEEILRRKKIEENESFYKINIDEGSIHDLKILYEIRSDLNKSENFDKMIYDTYIAKPTNEMIKRVLSGESPSGIYKITRLKTGEIYIGKSTDIKNRWQQHVKSVFHCGTISHSTLHTTMEKDGIQNWTFELLEEVPKDKLTEREKYWIEFYDSKKYGLNERIG